MVSAQLKGACAPLILERMDTVSASMTIQEKDPVKNIVERPGSLAMVAASGQALYLYRVVE
jgi:hypothetical protein